MQQHRRSFSRDSTFFDALGESETFRPFRPSTAVHALFSTYSLFQHLRGGFYKGMSGGAPAKPAADAGAGAMGAMAGQLAKGGAAEPNTMANAPVSKTNTAKPGNPNAAPAATQTAPEPAPAAEPTAAPVTTPVKQRTGGRVKGQLSQDPRAVKRREANAAKQQATEPKKKPAAPDQATIDAERERIMGPTSDSIIRTRPMMAEGFSLFRKH